ncbi:hypothetical protein QOT17_009533 [Balamuthia mandrillaris]
MAEDLEDRLHSAAEAQEEDDADRPADRFLLPDLESERPPPSLPPIRRHGEHNTGPKGVIQDYKEEQKRQRDQQEIRQLQLQYEINKKTVVYHSWSAQDAEKRELDMERQQEEKARQKEEASEEEEDLDDEDDEFLKQYRAMRLRELMDQKKYRFGTLKRINKQEWAEEVDSEIATGCFVVIHLYSEMVPPCVRANYVLEELARKHPDVKFLKIPANEAKRDWDEVALPTLLVYRKGENYAQYVRFIDDIGYEFDEDDLEAFLIRCVLPPSVSPAIPLFLSSGAFLFACCLACFSFGFVLYSLTLFVSVFSKTMRLLIVHRRKGILAPRTAASSH